MQQMTEDPLVEKIVSDLHRAIKKFPEICEFELIPSAEAQRNKSPVIHIGSHLGLETWCVKQMFTYILNTIIAIRKCRTKSVDTNRLDRLLLGGLLINPDITTFWNIRRELVLEMCLDIRYELHICKIIISHKPKSNESFVYREWILQRIMKINDLTNSIDLMHGQLHSIIIDELDIGTRAIEKCANNYHATNYKLYIIRQLAPLVLNFETILKSELNRSEIAMSKAVSDSSIFFYRQQLIQILKHTPLHLDDKYLSQIHVLLKQNISNSNKVDTISVTDILVTILGRPPSSKFSILRLNCLSNLLTILLYELSYISELNNMFALHETIWYHRRFVLWELMNIMYNFYDTNIESEMSICNKVQVNGGNIVDQSTFNKSIDLKAVPFDCILLYKMIIENEKKEMECCTRDFTQVKFVERHKKWLLLNFNLTV